jgi:hypothetical protein
MLNVVLKSSWLAVLVLVAPTGSAQDQVDPAVAGRWTLTFRNDAGEWEASFDVAANGTYVASVRGPAAVPEERGDFRARDGRWSVKATSGRTDEGIYEIRGDVLVLTGRGGPVRWTRQKAKALPETPAPKATALLPPKPPEPGMLDYLDAIDRLEAGRWDEALGAFSRAAVARPRTPPYVYGHIAALLFLERFGEAHRELATAFELENPRNDLELARVLALGCLMSRQTERLFWYHQDFPRDGYDRYLKQAGETYATGRADARDAVKALLPAVAARFAASRRRADPAAWALLHRAFERHGRKEYAAAAADCEAVIGHFPMNFTAMGLRAKCLLAQGAWEPARILFTQVLSYRTDVTEAYLGRAAAAARQGDARRVKADLDVARRLDPAATARAEAEIGACAAPPGSPAKLFGDLLAASGRGDSDPSLATLAGELRRAMHVTRLRYDEVYQERQRVHQWARDAAPKDPECLAAMGRFLRETADPLAEQVEPLGAFRYYRMFEPHLQEIERNYAERFFDAGLRQDPDHVPSLVGKAGCRIRRTDWDAAEGFLKHALQVDPDSQDVLELMEEVQRHNASVQFWNALQLRQTKTVEHSSSTTTVTTFYNSHGQQVGQDKKTETSSWIQYIPPTAEELAQAQRHEDAGKRMAAFGASLRSRAAQKRKGTPEGFAQEGLALLAEGRAVDAVRSLERAVSAAPAVVRYAYSLASALRAAGRDADANDVLDRARNAEHTTAAVWLQIAWTELVGKNAPAARAALERARGRDPGDARVPAYLELAALLEGRLEEAVAYGRAALALEEARARESLASFGSGIPRRLDWKEFGLTLRVRLNTAAALRALKRPAEALALLGATTSLAEGRTAFELSRDLDVGLLPLAWADPSAPGEPSFLAALLARSHAGAARALRDLGRREEAAAEASRPSSYADRMFDDSLRINDITVRPGHKRPELQTYTRTLTD